MLNVMQVLSDELQPSDDLDTILYAGRTLLEDDEATIVACIQMSRTKQVSEWVNELKSTCVKCPSRISSADFTKLFFQVAEYSKHNAFVVDKPIDTWIASIESCTEKGISNARFYEKDQGLTLI